MKVKRQPVSIYLDAIEFSVIKEAAMLLGESRAEFIRHAAYKRASQTLFYAQKFNQRRK